MTDPIKWALETAKRLGGGCDVAAELLRARALQATLDGNNGRALQLGAAAELLFRKQEAA